MVSVRIFKQTDLYFDAVVPVQSEYGAHSRQIQALVKMKNVSVISNGPMILDTGSATSTKLSVLCVISFNVPSVRYYWYLFNR